MLQVTQHQLSSQLFAKSPQLSFQRTFSDHGILFVSEMEKEGKQPIQSWLGLVYIELVTVRGNWSSTLLVMF